MDNIKIGSFIATLRKQKVMTQKDLAERLSITDKAVSKWERGLSYPDITLLPTLAEILDVTVSELLNGERSSDVSPEAEAVLDQALYYAGQSETDRAKTMGHIRVVVFSAVLLIGGAVCAICDVSISRGFTWSLFPIYSILFGWFVLFPTVKWAKKGILWTLVIQSLLVIPYLWALDTLIPLISILHIGIPMSVIALSLLWGIYGAFRLLKKSPWQASAVSCLLGMVACVVVNLFLSRILSEPILDIWDLLSLSVLGIGAMLCFIIGTFA